MTTLSEQAANRTEVADLLAEDEGCEMILEISTETRNLLARLASESGGTEFDVIGKALSLYRVAMDARNAGKRIGILDDDLELDREIVGL